VSSIEQRIFAQWIDQGASALDLGCGDGTLLSFLARERGVRGQGIELDIQAVSRCVSDGLSVYQQDIDTGLSEYADDSFDYVILNQTLQQVKKPDQALEEALRVGKKAIVGIPNFAFYKARASICLRGRVPVTAALPYQWYDTPNLHFLSLANFKVYCQQHGITIKQAAYRSGDHAVLFLFNIFAEVGYFLLQSPQS
jgi:methionine biosynthesis protein MetW